MFAFCSHIDSDPLRWDAWTQLPQPLIFSLGNGGGLKVSHRGREYLHGVVTLKKEKQDKTKEQSFSTPMFFFFFFFVWRLVAVAYDGILAITNS